MQEYKPSEKDFLTYRKTVPANTAAIVEKKIYEGWKLEEMLNTEIGKLVVRDITKRIERIIGAILSFSETERDRLEMKILQEIAWEWNTIIKEGKQKTSEVKKVSEHLNKRE